MYAPILAAGLALISGVAADIAITYPNGGTTWYYNSTVHLNWTATETDPKVFRVFLENKDISPTYGPQEIQQEVTTASLQNGLLLPGVTAAEGYVVSFVNTTNITQVYTQSEKFRIEAGNFSTTSTAVSSTSSSAASTLAPFVSSSSSANPFASGSATPSPGSGAGHIVAPVAAVVLAVAGAALAL